MTRVRFCWMVAGRLAFPLGMIRHWWAFYAGGRNTTATTMLYPIQQS